MNVSTVSFFSRSSLYHIEQISLKLTPLQKKAAAIGLAYFCFVGLCFAIYKLCIQQHNVREEKNDGRLLAIAKNALPHKSVKETALQPKVVLVEDQTNSMPKVQDLQPLDSDSDTPVDAPRNVDPLPVAKHNPQTRSIGEIETLIDESKSLDDFLSILRCLADHPEWVSANIEETIDILHHFGNRYESLQPIKIVADLYEKLLDDHPLLRTDARLKNTEILFENRQSYQTHLIIALKNLHLIRSLFEDELKQDQLKKGNVKIHVNGNAKELIAIFQYLDRSDPSAISQIDYFQIMKIGIQYEMPSILRYCEAHKQAKIPLPLKNWLRLAEATKEFCGTLQKYAILGTKHINFLIDYLLSHMTDNMHTEKEMIQYIEGLNFDQLDPLVQKDLQAKLLERVKIIFSKGDDLREEHEDRIVDSIDIVEKLASRLKQPTATAGYISCSSINRALKILFKASIANQLKTHPDLGRIKDSLSAICASSAITSDTSWKSIEWDVEEAGCIPSLAASLFNYLNDDIPDEIKTLSCWHGESLVLAFNEIEKKKTPLSDCVINFAENAVSRSGKIGFHYLLRPSSRAASFKNSIVFTLTAYKKSDVLPGAFVHSRIEANFDPLAQKWLYKERGSQQKGLPFTDFIATLAMNLKQIPVEVPKTSARRVSEYM